MLSTSPGRHASYSPENGSRQGAAGLSSRLHDARPLETLQGLGLWPRAQNYHRREGGINEVRKLLPRCGFDADRCARGIEALRHYRADWDERRQVFSGEPRHDWASQGADAFRNLAMGRRDPEKNKPLPKIV